MRNNVHRNQWLQEVGDNHSTGNVAVRFLHGSDSTPESPKETLCVINDDFFVAETPGISTYSELQGIFVMQATAPSEFIALNQEVK